MTTESSNIQDDELLASALKTISVEENIIDKMNNRAIKGDVNC